MNKFIFGIFAHPDDEAMGPAGALLLETRTGTELHLVTLTSGQGGANPDSYENLGEARLEEWHKSGQLLGAKSMHFLGYEDGHLDNVTMIAAADQLVELIKAVLKEAPQDAEVEVMAFDLNGYTGHIDHIVASRAACLAFYRLKKSDDRLKRIRLNCMTREQVSKDNIDWIYMEQGRSDTEINETVDAREFHDELLTVIRTHHSQRSDGETHIKNRGADLGLNYFIVKT
jgi:LmbE family N-acetylglucosaminyl deacetylase